MSATTTEQTPAVAARAGRSSRFRPDIEGLRAIAVGLVLVYHAGVRQLPGGFIGVDIFFVISGFLITGLLVREVESTGRLSMARFYARRAKRLLPATAVVLVATSIITWVWLPQTQRAVLGGDIVSAALYVVNWRLAARSVDYLAEGVTPSPVQHFWSLAVEEQFYVVWPLVILLLLLVVRRFRLPLRSSMALGIAAIGVPSLVFSVWMTSNDPSRAFFVTTTRMWELAIGGAVAIGAAHWSRLPAWFSHVLVWGGLATLGWAALFLHGDAVAWPGSLALVPVLAAAAIIVGGFSAAGPAARLLGARPMVWVGGLSYSLYLWHWPLLIGAAAAWGELGAKKGLLVVAATFVPAWLCFKLVEGPFRSSEWISAKSRRGLGIGALCTAIGAAAGLMVALPSAADTEPPAGAGAPPGVHALLSGDPDWFVEDPTSITPSPAGATDDVPAIYADGCQVTATKPVPCVYGDKTSSTVWVLAGDSKAAQWQSALDEIAKREHVKLVTMLKSACAFSDGGVLLNGEAFPDCATWNPPALDAVLKLEPAVVLTSQGAYRALADKDDPDSANEPGAMVDALTSRWQTLSDHGIPVIALSGNPNPPQEIYECVAEHRHHVSDCSFPGKAPVADVQRKAADRVDSAQFLELNDMICPDGTCPAVIGGVLAYRQGSHLTRTFIDSMTDELQKRLDPLLSR